MLVVEDDWFSVVGIRFHDLCFLHLDVHPSCDTSVVSLSDLSWMS